MLFGMLLAYSSASGIPVLMYHEIRTSAKNDTELRKDLSCSREHFLQHLDWINKQGYTTITTGQLVRYDQSKKYIMLTFDDGRASLNWAANVLHQRGMVGVFYINTGAIGTSEHLSKKQITDMSQIGMEIGSHTVSHCDLRMISRKQLTYELTQSKRVLEELISRSIESLAYPSGRYNQKVIKSVKESGYLTARTTEFGVHYGKNNYKIPVIRIHPTTTTRDLVQIERYGL